LQAPESNRVTDLMKVSSVPTSLQYQVSGIRLQASGFGFPEACLSDSDRNRTYIAHRKRLFYRQLGLPSPIDPNQGFELLALRYKQLLFGLRLITCL
jgi:hypothetical protein